MDEKTKELIAIGASVATNCQPCLTHHVDKADALGIGEDDIREALAIGAQVQKGGMNAMQRFIEQVLDSKPETAPAQKKKASTLKVYDPPMCCPTGVCGPNVSQELVEFAGLFKQTEKLGIELHRWNLSQQSGAFVENNAVREAMAERGQEGLPLIYVDDELVVSGRYPGKQELFDLLGINGNDPGNELEGSEPNKDEREKEKPVFSVTGIGKSDSGDCCPGGGCC